MWLCTHNNVCGHLFLCGCETVNIPFIGILKQSLNACVTDSSEFILMSFVVPYAACLMGGEIGTIKGVCINTIHAELENRFRCIIRGAPDRC